VAHNLLELALASGGHENVGIEIARLIVPPDVAALLPPKENYIALKVVIAMLLIAFTTMCVLIYLTFFNN